MSTNFILFFSLFVLALIECRHSCDYIFIDQLIGQWFVTDIEILQSHKNPNITCATMKMTKINATSGRLTWNEVIDETYNSLETIGIRLPYSRLLEISEDGSWNNTAYIRIFNRGEDIVFIPNRRTLPMLVLSHYKVAAPSTYQALSRIFIRELKLRRIPNIECSFRIDGNH